ncbi:hypothetical protein FB446DRAFT_711543 [Lentinula raphanica]|nr:hypothetical protein FB446DRAFT_711543 [Lentinula raphanica]
MLMHIPQISATLLLPTTNGIIRRSAVSNFPIAIKNGISQVVRAHTIGPHVWPRTEPARYGHKSNRALRGPETQTEIFPQNVSERLKKTKTSVLVGSVE